MEYRGPWPDIDLGVNSLYELLFESLADDDLDRVAFDHVETGTVLTFGQVRDQVDAVATWLAAQGVTSGDVVAVMLRNRPEYAAAFHGILRCGATVTPVSTASDLSAVVRQLQLTGARLVIAEADFVPLVRETQALAGVTEGRVVVLDQPATGDGLVAWDEVLATAPQPPELVVDPATHVACLPMSSGTSGLPKAVMLSQRNLIANTLQFSPVLGELPPEASMVVFLPYSHIYAMTAQLNLALLRRVTQYTMSSFQAHLFLQIIVTKRPTVLFVVPPVATMLARSSAVDGVDWSSVQLLVSGAAPLDAAVAERLVERTGAVLVQGLGMTETSPGIAVSGPQCRHWPIDGVGAPLANTRVRVVDPETGRDVEPPAPGEWSAPGELWASGPQVMLGYLGNPEESDSMLEGGWVHTGDLVQVGDENVLRVVGRIKELIKRNGYQIAPAELEALLLHHPEVADAAVLGVPQPSGDEAPFALLVLHPTATGDSRQVLGWFNEQVSSHKRISRARVVDALPRNGAGKLQRRDLVALVG